MECCSLSLAVTDIFYLSYVLPNFVTIRLGSELQVLFFLVGYTFSIRDFKTEFANLTQCSSLIFIFNEQHL